MNPAKQVIEKFGGQSALAKLLGKRQGTVQYWARTGMIPSKRQPELLKLAKKHGIELHPREFMADSFRREVPPVRVGPPEAKHKGFLNLLDIDIPVYVLTSGQRVVGRTSATEMLTDIKGGGSLEKYLGVTPLKPFINIENVLERMVSFVLPEVQGLQRAVKGLPADLLIEICQGFVNALQAEQRGEARLTDRQRQMAIKAGMFVSACAKVGLDALIDEVTGYQYDRAEEALQVKLRAYLADEMRKWEKTFPDQLWIEFGRLTNWKGSVTQRPKYWGKLVLELVYEYLDPDVAEWLKTNAPKPIHGQNYHQWLNEQYGLKRLTEHIWMLIGMAAACHSMLELKRKMAERFGRVNVQYTLFIPAETTDQ